MFSKLRSYKNRMLAMILAIVACLGGIFGQQSVVQAADGTLHFNSGDYLDYGSYRTTKMTFDGDNTAYCLQPMKKTPPIGDYEYELLSENSAIRKALYYLPGGYGYDHGVQAQYFSGWSADDAYIIGHLTVAYIYGDYDIESGAFYGAPDDYINKAIDMANAIAGMPEPPKAFRAFIIPDGKRQTIAGSWYKAPAGYVEIYKTTANADVSEGNLSYTLAGATYGVFKGEEQVAELVTDETGYAKSGELEEGMYAIRETEASRGFAIDVNEYQVEVKADETIRLDVKEIPQNNPIELLLQKVDSETKQSVAQGSGNLGHTEFTVKYFAEQMDTNPEESGCAPLRTWVFKTDDTGKIQFTKDYMVCGDEFYYQADGSTICFPLGTVTIEETKAPEGYLRNEIVHVQAIRASGTEETVESYENTTVEEQVFRGDLELVKVSDGDLKRLANVPFSIISKTTGESHIIVTDKNGYASTAASWNKHSANTNQGKESTDGIWFGEGEADNSKGALIYDTYLIKEQRCDSNKGMKLLEMEVSVYKDSVTVPLGTVTNDKFNIHTSAKDGKDGDNVIVAEKNAVIIDTVDIKEVPNGEYKLVGTIMDKSTGKELQIGETKISAETTFSKENLQTVDVKFEFDASELGERDLVVFEKLYEIRDGKEIEVASHEDIDDEGQTIHVKKPETPEKPQTPKEKVTNPPKTGDKSNMIFWGVLMTIACILGGVVIKMRKQRGNR